MAHLTAIQIYRTATANQAPSGLAQGELAVEMATQPPRLWCGVPTSIAAAGQIRLNASSAAGTAAPATPATGDLWYNTTTGQLMVWNGSTWAAVSSAGGGGSGTVTSITAGAGLAGGVITTTGTISLTSPVTIANGGTGNTTAPTAGQIEIAQSGTSIAPVTLGGDGTITSAGALTVTRTQGTAFTALATATVPLSVANGGSGNGTAPASGQIHIAANGTTFVPQTIAGDGTLNSSGTLTITKTAGVAFTALATASIPLSVANGGSGSGTAPTLGQIWIAQSGTSFTPQTISGDGTISNIGSLVVTKTNGTAFSGLATAAIPLSVANGGTAATTAPSALTSLGAAPTASPTFTGTPTAPTATVGTNTTQLSTTQFVLANAAPLTNPASGQNNYAPLASPTFTGTVTLPDGSSIVTAGGNNGVAGFVYGYQNVTGLGIGYARTGGNPQVGGNVLICGQTTTPCVLFQTSGFQPTAAINYVPGISGAFNLSTGAYSTGAAWMATNANAAIFNFPANAAAFSIFLNQALSAGSTYSPSLAMALNLNGLAVTGTVSGSYGVIAGTAVGASQIYIGASSGASTAAATLTSVVANNVNLATGAYYNGVSWIANATSAMVFSGNGGNFQFYVNSGLTVGSGFSPALVASVNADGSIVGRSYSLVAAGIPANTYWAYGVAGQTASSFIVNNGALWHMRPSDLLSYNPTGPVGGLGAYQNICDIRFKKNVEPEARGLEVIKQLKPIMFQRSNPDGKLRAREVGFSAQDVKSVLPEAVVVIGEKLADGSGGLESDDPTLGIAESAIFTLMVNALKEIDKRLAAVEKKKS
jgi:hypothetical protein